MTQDFDIQLNGIDESLALAAVEAHNACVQSGNLVKNDKKRRISRVVLDGQIYVVKEYVSIHYLKCVSLDSKCWKGTALVPGAAKCLAWLRGKGRAWIVQENAGDGDLFQPCWQDNLPLAERQFQAAGRALAALHAQGIYHADTKPGNFVTKTGQPQVTIIDCDDVRKYHRISNAHKMKNLAQFCGCLWKVTDDVARHRLVDAFLHGYGDSVDDKQLTAWIGRIYGTDSKLRRLCRRWLGLALVTVLAVGACMLVRSAASNSIVKYDTAFVAFNTECQISIWTADKDLNAKICSEIIGDVTKMHAYFNRFDKNSFVATFNSLPADKMVDAPEHVMRIMLAARDAWIATDGVFDVTMAPMLKLWKQCAKENRRPTSEEMAAAKAISGFDKVVIDVEKGMLGKNVNGLSLDFGGIAKGYALDRAREILAKHGQTVYLLNFGGNVCCGPDAPANKDGFLIGLKHPANDGSIIETRTLLNRCIATSANYERGKTQPHIINPITGNLCDQYQAVTIISDSGVWADVLSTAVFASTPNVVERFRETECIVY